MEPFLPHLKTQYMIRRIFLMYGILGWSYCLTAQVTFSGEMKRWHKVTLTFDGPQTNEQHSYNPFLNYRLDVTFRNGNRTFVVPGYYAADGQAAETSATKGNKWRGAFLPGNTPPWG